MNANIDLLRALSDTLDKLVLKVDPDLPMADDIHPAIHKVGEYLADLVRLPAELAKLEAQKASVEVSVPAREKAVRAAKHAVMMIETKLKKLGERIDHNMNALSNEDEAEVIAAPSVIAGISFPTRQELIESLRREILAAEDELAATRVPLKQAESLRKGVVTRLTNLAVKVDAAKKAVADHGARLEETIKLLRKTINHLQNRQAKRDRKRAVATVAAVPEAVESAPAVPSDEDILAKAAAHGFDIKTDGDLAAARQLFLN